MLIPRRCPLCERPGPAPCGACAAGLRRAGWVPPVVGLDSVTAVFAYEGALRSLLLALKYGNRRDCLGWLGRQMGTALGDAPRPDVVTWAPTSAGRAGRRGFDQAELLARAVAGELGRPVRPLLRRAGTGAQTGLDAAGRRAGPRFQPSWRLSARSAPARVLLVDDVATTGATLAAGAAALRSAGSEQVHALVVAHTPAPGGSRAAASPTGADPARRGRVG